MLFASVRSRAQSHSRMCIGVVAWSLLSIPGRPGFLTTHLQLLPRESRRLPDRSSRNANGLNYGVSAAAATSKVVIRSVAFPCPVRSSWHCFEAFAAPGVGEASALLSHPSGSGSPVPVPPKKQPLVWGTAPTCFPVPETNGQNRRNVCTSTESPRKVKILERAETMGDGPTRSERPWEDVTHQFWTV